MSSDILSRVVESDGDVIAHIYDMTAPSGKSFPTPDHFAMQFGVGVIDEDWTSNPHIHKPVTREVVGTAEFIFIIEGRLDAVFYDEQEHEVASAVLTDKMALLQLKGGHKLTFAKGTTYFELKQGPYRGRDWDKYDL